MMPMRWAQRVGKAETAGAKAALCAVVKKKDGDWERPGGECAGLACRRQHSRMR